MSALKKDQDLNWLEEKIEENKPKLKLLNWSEEKSVTSSAVKSSFELKTQKDHFAISKLPVAKVKPTTTQKTKVKTSFNPHSTPTNTTFENFITSEELDNLIETHKKFLNKLDQLEHLKVLASFEPNIELDKLKVLDKLEQLKSLDSLEKLESLKELEKIDVIDEKLKESLEKLEMLSKLDELSQLKNLSELKSINKLDQLSKLEHLKLLSNLSQLSNVEKLTILKDDKITKVVEKLNNIPMIKDSMPAYLAKSAANTLLDLVKVIAIAAGFFYFSQTNIGQMSTITAMELIGFSNASKTNLALNMIASTNDKKVLKQTLNNTILKVEQQIDNVFALSSSQLYTAQTVNQVADILSYDFHFNKFSFQAVIDKKLNARIENSINSFKSTLDYAYAKDLVSENDLMNIEKINNSLQNKNYQQVIKSSKPLLSKDYKFVEHALRVAIFKLYREDKQKIHKLIN